MRLLLDTHVAVWWLSGDRRLSAAATSAIQAAEESVLSVVSLWEIMIKQGKGRLELPLGFVDVLREDFGELPLTGAHVIAARDLPALHRDPFDRMLVGQALTEGLTIVTADRSLPAYGVPILPA